MKRQKQKCEIKYTYKRTNTDQFTNLEKSDAHLDTHGLGSVERRQRGRFIVDQQVSKKAVCVLGARLQCAVDPRRRPFVLITVANVADVATYTARQTAMKMAQLNLFTLGAT